MNSVDFCFWLQGFFELSDVTELTTKQVETIKNHLNLVFLHEIDPMRESETTATKTSLDTVHSNQKPTLVGPAMAILPTNDDVKPYRPQHSGGFSNDPLIRC